VLGIHAIRYHESKSSQPITWLTHKQKTKWHRKIHNSAQLNKPKQLTQQMQAKPDFVILIWPSVKKQGGPFRRLSKDGHYLHQNEQIGRTQQRAVMGWRWKYQHQRSDSDFFRWYGCFRGVCVTWMPRLMQPSLLVHFRLEMLCKEFCIAQSSNRWNICDKLTPKTNTIMSVYRFYG